MDRPGSTNSATSPTSSMWTYPRGLGRSVIADILGYQVVATDGEIGHIDEATDDIDSAAIVVDTGSWIFGSKRMIPAGVIDRIDADMRTVQVRMTKDEIRNAPDFIGDVADGEAHLRHRAELTGYYSRWWG